MSDNKYWYLEGQRKPGLYRWIFEQMALGAVYSALVLFGAILFILLLIGVSRILPEDPFALLQGVTAAAGVVT